MNFGKRSKLMLRYERAKAKLNEFAVSDEDRKNNMLIYTSSVDLLYSTIRVLSEYAEVYSTGTDATELYNELSFVSRFYENFIEAEQEKDDYFFYLTGGIANILSDNFGNAKSLISQINNTKNMNWIARIAYDFIATGLNIIRSATTIQVDAKLYEDFLKPLEIELKSGQEKNDAENRIKYLVDITLKANDSESAFFANLLFALRKKFIENSAIRCIPEFSDSNISDWDKYFRQQGSIKILWQAQKLLLEKDILKGKNATIQLPTGVGKTKSIELIISAAFLLRDVSLAIVVAPLRALCNEIEKDLERSIKNIVSFTDISDVLTEDFDFDFEKRQVIILTPEKLSFLIKHENDIIHKCGLIIFDEAHMFDDPSRGATYELLIVRVKNLLAAQAQRIFISAVMRNAEQINDWLTDGSGTTITDKYIKRTEKSVGFFSQSFNSIQFFEQQDLINSGEEMVFIPQICPPESFVLSRYQNQATKNGKTYKRGDIKESFPECNVSTDMALYLSFKLCKTGSVAIYVNKPKLIYSIAKKVTALYEKNYSELKNIFEKSNSSEIDKIFFLAKEHFGEDEEFVKVMKLGVFPHFGNLENGLRVSIEYAIKKGSIVFVVCTSTLAEGVNLPIRYLIITSFKNVYGQKLSTRKFQNLLGRTARAGIYTEGSLICSEHQIIDKKLSNPKQWTEVVNTFNPSNSEDCNSAILQIFDGLDLVHYYGESIPLPGKIIVEQYLELYAGRTFNIVDELYLEISKWAQSKRYSLRLNAYDRLKNRIASIKSIIETIEVAISDDGIYEQENENPKKVDLAELTLAYKLANEEQKELLKHLFNVVENKINTVSPEKRDFFAKSMNDIDTFNMVDKFLQNRQDLYNDCEFDVEAWITAIVELSRQYSKMSDAFINLSEQKIIALINAWINGKSYKDMIFITNINLNKLINICQNDMGYSLNYLIACLIELLKQYKPEDKTDLEWEIFIEALSAFQQRIKYGLFNNADIAAYEIGFSDRVLAGKIGKLLLDRYGEQTLSAYKLNIIDSKAEIEEMMKNYPSYFAEIASRLN